MAVGDQVIFDYRQIASPGIDEPPLRGRSSSEAGNDVTVLWQNAELTTFLNTFLRKVFTLPDAALSIIGKYVQVTDWPVAGTGHNNKSPGCSGIVVDAVAHGAFGAPNADQVDLVVATENGQQHIMLTAVFDFNTNEFIADAPFRIDSGRREV